MSNSFAMTLRLLLHVRLLVNCSELNPKRYLAGKRSFRLERQCGQRANSSSSVAVTQLADILGRSSFGILLEFVMLSVQDRR